MAGSKKKIDPYRPVADPERGKRIGMVRLLFHKEPNQAKFARDFGVTPQRWAHWEKGTVPMPEEALKEYVRRSPGLSVDWLLLEDTDRLHANMLRTLYPSGKWKRRS